MVSPAFPVSLEHLGCQDSWRRIFLRRLLPAVEVMAVAVLFTVPLVQKIPEIKKRSSRSILTPTSNSIIDSFPSLFIL
jgi:hypothetical protein